MSQPVTTAVRFKTSDIKGIIEHQKQLFEYIKEHSEFISMMLIIDVLKDKDEVEILPVFTNNFQCPG